MDHRAWEALVQALETAVEFSGEWAGDPERQASLHTQRSILLSEALGRGHDAVEACRAALKARPAHLDAVLALRDLALQLDDEALAVEAFDHCLEHLSGGSLPPADAAALFGAWLFIWTMRWRAGARAERALEAEAAHDPLGLSERLEHLFARPEAQAGRMAVRQARARTAEARRRIAGRRGLLLLDLGQVAEGLAVLEDADPADKAVAWRRVEIAAMQREGDALTVALSRLVRTLPPGGVGVVRFLAAERAEFLEDDPQRADDLYGRTGEATLPAILSVKRVLLAAAAAAGAPATFEDAADPLDSLDLHTGSMHTGSVHTSTIDGHMLPPLEALAHRYLEAAAAATNTGLQSVFADRAAKLLADCGAVGHVEQAAELGGDQAARAVERLLWQQRRWQELADAFMGGIEGLVQTPAPEISHRQRATETLIRAAICEHALFDRNAALKTLSAGAAQLDTHPVSALMAARSRQRLAGARPDPEVLQGLRMEADQHPDTHRRVTALVQLARLSLDRPEIRLDAHVALGAALNLQPDHFTALAIGVELSRVGGRPAPRIEALSRALEALPMGPLARRWWLDLGELAPEHPGAARGAVERLRKRLKTALADEGCAGAVAALLKAADRLATLRDLAAHAPPHIQRRLGSLSIDDSEESPPTRVTVPPDMERPGRPSLTGGSISRLAAALGGQNKTPVKEVPTRDVITRETRQAEAALDGDLPDHAVEAHLGEARTPTHDRSRSIIKAKLARARKGAVVQTGQWPDCGRADISAAIGTLSGAIDAPSRAEAAAELAERYEAASEPKHAIRAWREVLAWRAGERRAVDRLVILCRRIEDWKTLGETLNMAIQQTGDVERQRTLQLEAARLRMGPLDDPGGALPHLEAALAGLPAEDPQARTLRDTLASALESLGRWSAYAEVVGQMDLAAEPTRALKLGRIKLHQLSDPQGAAPLLEQAAEALKGQLSDRAFAEVLSDLATLRAGQDRLSEALELLQTAADGDPERAGQHRAAAARLLETHGGDEAQVRAAWQAALAAGAREAAVLDRLERLALEARDWSLLAEVLEAQYAEAVGAPTAERHDLAVRLGHLYYSRLEDPIRAARRLVEAYELDANDGTNFKLAESLIEQHAEGGPLRIRLYAARLDALMEGTEEVTRGERVAVARRLAAAYDAEGRVDEAVSTLARQRDLLGPDHPQAMSLMAPLEHLYKKAGRWSALVDLYREGLARTPEPAQRAVLLRHLAQAQEVGQRDLSAAAETLRALLRITPDDLSALRSRCRLLEALKRWDELLEASRQELELLDDDRMRAYVLFRIGSIHETHLGDPEAARGAYERVLRLDPRNMTALHGLRALATAQGDWRGVIALLEREVGLWKEPREQAAVLARIGAIYGAELGAPHRAMDLYQQAWDLWPGCLPAARALAEHARTTARWADAARFYDAITAQNLDSWPVADRAQAFCHRGEVALRLGHTLEAVESLRIALEFNPRDPEILGVLVEAYGQLEEPDVAGLMTLHTRLDAAHAEAERQGDVAARARIDILRGRAAEQALDLEMAEEHYARATEILPRQLDAWRPLVDLHLRSRRWVEATRALNAFCDAVEPWMGDDDALRDAWRDAQLEAGDIWLNRAVDPARAEAAYQRVIEASPGPADPLYRQARARMAQCAYLGGAFKKARRIMMELIGHLEGGSTFDGIGRVHEDPRAQVEAAQHRVYLGVILSHGFQETAQAARQFESALQADPRCASALLALLRLQRDQSLLDGGSPDQALATLAEHERLVEQGDFSDPGAATLRIFAARLLAESQPDKARRWLTELAEVEGPGQRDARFALVRAHSEVTGEARDDTAITAQLFRLLDQNVCDREALRALVRHTERLDDDRHFRALEALALFDTLTEEELKTYRRLEDRARSRIARGGRALSDGVFARSVAHPAFHSPLVRLAALCDSALARAFSLRPTPEDTRGIRPRGSHPFGAELDALSRLIGAQAPFRFDAEGVEPLTLHVESDPTVVIGGEPLGGAWPVAATRFLAGRALGACRFGLARLHGLERERGLELLATLSELTLVKGDPLGEEAPARFVADALSKRVVEEIRAVLHPEGQPEHAGQTSQPGLRLSPEESGEAVLVGITRTLDRAGLLACGLLRPAIGGLARLQTGVEGALVESGDLTWAVRNRPRLKDLVKYALSDACRAARQAAGLLI